MSTVQTIDSLRPFERALVNGYFLVNFSDYTPTEIINLCIFYCFVFDEFAQIPPSKAQIKGINNEIVTLCPMDTVLPGAINCSFTRNVLEASGRYHWSFKITKCKDAVITFGFMQNNKYIEGYTFYPSDAWNKLDIFHVYLNADNKVAAYKIAEHVGYYKNTQININDIDNIRLYVSVHSNPATLEMIAFHDTEWYMNKLQNKEDSIVHIGYARSIHDIHDKIKHYLIALKKYPLVESWNNEYLICLQQNKQYDIAYNHVLKWKKGKIAISKLSDYYYCFDVEDYEKALSLLKVLDDETLEKMDLFFETAYCYNRVKEDDFQRNALKYYQLYYDQHQYDSDDDTKEAVTLCIGNMANIQYAWFKNTRDALPLFLQLNEIEIHRREFNGKIGFCYWKEKDYENSLKYYQLHLDRHPNDIWIHKKIYWTHHAQKKYAEAHGYLVKALDLAKEDKQKEALYLNLGANAYFTGNLQDAIKYTKQTLKLNVSSERISALIYCNLGKFYYKLAEYYESQQYLLKAIKIDPNDVHVIANYGILLYFMKRFNESIDYLDKCLSNDQKKISDPELLPDCLYIYGQILYDKNEYNQSINKCLKATKIDEFINYRYKDKIYYLLSINYEKLCEYEKSLQFVLKAKTLSPDNEEYQQKLVTLQSN